MSDDPLILRTAQQQVLNYRGGRMAVSAVPGSGKTFTLSLLAAQLISEGSIEPGAGQQVLIVTYLNASVEHFKAGIRRRLARLGQPDKSGYDVRTLHSLALEIVRQSTAGLGESDDLTVLDDIQSGQFLSRAIDSWIDDNRDMWQEFVEPGDRQSRARWRSITHDMAKGFIRTAKNERYRPEAILTRLSERSEEADFHSLDQATVDSAPLLVMLTGIYRRYQAILTRQAAFDFDDLVWRAYDLLDYRSDLAEHLRNCWPFVLEDEAQDSVPLQEDLLGLMTGRKGNWVRVGDPNQAITSTFTAAHPRFFNAFIDRPDVTALTLPNSGRSAPLIFEAANTMLDWVIDHHPLAEIRGHTFRRQHILPTPAGDAQPNPPDAGAGIRIRVYGRREDEELPDVARLAIAYTEKFPQRTVAVLVPTNNMGYAIAKHLDDHEADYDNLLRGGSREREIAGALYAMLNILADPHQPAALYLVHQALHELGHPVGLAFQEDDAETARYEAILKSIHQPERFLLPYPDQDFREAFPAGTDSAIMAAAAEPLAEFVQELFKLRPLPIDDLILSLGDELFTTTGELDLSIAYQIANALRSWGDLYPEWRLPDLAQELRDVASGRRRLAITTPSDLGFEPGPGRITLATQHGAKGMEWDAVFLVGIDGRWIPNDLDAPFLGVEELVGGDPIAEAKAQLRFLMSSDLGAHPARTPTEAAHLEVISERLRLLYVGITRARRHLVISRSRAKQARLGQQRTEPATVMGVLYRYWQGTQNGS